MTIFTEIKEFKQILQTYERLIGIDYGEKNIGLAISDPSRKLATPYEVIREVKLDLQIKKISEVAEKEEVTKYIVGLPLEMTGNMGSSSSKVLAFVDKFAALHPECSFYLIDERMSSKAAMSLLRDAGIKRKQKNQVDHKLAASIILQNFLDLAGNFSQTIDFI